MSYDAEISDVLEEIIRGFATLAYTQQAEIICLQEGLDISHIEPSAAPIVAEQAVDIVHNGFDGGLRIELDRLRDQHVEKILAWLISSDDEPPRGRLKLVP